MEDPEDEDPSVSREFQSYEDDDPTDDVLDFRFANLASVKSGGQLPKRGEKDFEQHGTKNQESILESSRQAMYDAFAHVRSHTPKNHVRGFYYGETGRRMKMYEIFDQEARHGLQDDHVVLVESVKGPHFKTIGKMTTKQKVPSLWLLPEEALYLIERGFLDLWWPPEELNVKKATNEGRDDEGTPMSLQAAYAMLIGDDNEKGKVSMDRYTVYGNLRRTGYVVQRAPDFNKLNNTQANAVCKVPESISQVTLFTWLFGNLFAKKKEHQNYGPLVRPGMYRSYNQIYQNLAVIPKHKPEMIVSSNSALDPEYPYRVVFFLWKGDDLKSFTKKNPGNPDFRIAVVDAHSVPIPSLSQMNALLASTPFNPPNLEKLGGPGKIYQRLKHGWRNVALAVVDQGVISYLKLVEGAFGEELMYQRLDKSGVRGTKRGYRSRSRGRGRGL